MAGVSTYLADAIMAHVFTAGGAAYAQPVGGLTVSLHTGDPGKTKASALANEVTEGGYSRKAGTFTAPTNGSVANTGVIEWTNMPNVTVTYAAVWDTTGDQLLGSGPLASPKTIPAGDTFHVNSGTLTITLN